MSGALSRRLAAAEVRHSINQAPKFTVRRRPDGITADVLAAWEAGEDKPAIPPDLDIVVRRFISWPPRSAGDVQQCMDSLLCATPFDLAARIRDVPSYSEQAAVLAAIPGVALQ